jgi:hypothetical protein
MPLLSKEQILAVDDLTYEDVEVPEWGGTVRVRMLTGAERDKFEESVMTRKGRQVDVKLALLRAKLVALTVVDEAGQRLFEERDVAALGQKSAVALNRVFEVAQRINGLTEKDVNELTENLSDGRSGGSTSG